MTSKDYLKKLLIIAEAGVNHNGEERLAIDLVNAAYEAKANIVKFQTFNAKDLVVKGTSKSQYQINNTNKKEDQFEMIKKLELSRDTFIKLSNYCDELNIEFLSTAFDTKSLNFLLSETNLKRIKISSGELSNAPLILEAARSGLPMIISTGMSSYEEIEKCLSVVAFGSIAETKEKPCIQAFQYAYFTDEGMKALRKKVQLLHCTSDYPASHNDVNVKVVKSLRNAFKLPVGYSDHTLDSIASILALSFGARIFEKHLTLDTNLDGPDHKSSLNPNDFTQYVTTLHCALNALGDGFKRLSPNELANSITTKKKLVAKHDMPKGKIIGKNDIDILRASTGISPIKYWDLVGTKLRNNLKKGDPFEI